MPSIRPATASAGGGAVAVGTVKSRLTRARQALPQQLPRVRSDSLAGVISLLANPGSHANLVRLDYDITAPRAVTDASIEMSGEAAEYALSAVVSREGRVQGIEVMNGARPLGNRAVVNAMLNEAYRVQFAPAQARTGNPVAVSMVWLVANTTVKGRHDDGLVMLRKALRPCRSRPPAASLFNLNLAGPDISQCVGRANHERTPLSVSSEPDLK